MKKKKLEGGEIGNKIEMEDQWGDGELRAGEEGVRSDPNQEGFFLHCVMVQGV